MFLKLNYNLHSITFTFKVYNLVIFSISRIIQSSSPLISEHWKETPCLLVVTTFLFPSCLRP